MSTAAERTDKPRPSTTQTAVIPTFGAVVRRGMKVHAHDPDHGDKPGIVVSVSQHGAFVDNPDDPGEPVGYPWHRISVYSQQELALFEPDRKPARILELVDTDEGDATPTDDQPTATDPAAGTALKRRLTGAVVTDFQDGDGENYIDCQMELTNSEVVELCETITRWVEKHQLVQREMAKVIIEPAFTAASTPAESTDDASTKAEAAPPTPNQPDEHGNTFVSASPAAASKPDDKPIDSPEAQKAFVERMRTKMPNMDPTPRRCINILVHETEHGESLIGGDNIMDESVWITESEAANLVASVGSAVAKFPNMSRVDGRNG